MPGRLTWGLAVCTTTGYEIYDVETGTLIELGLSLRIGPWQTAAVLTEEHVLMTKETKNADSHKQQDRVPDRQHDAAAGVRGRRDQPALW